MNDNQEVHGLEGRGRRLSSESTPVEQGHDFATPTGTLDREEMSELSDISTEIAATRRSPTDNTMMAGGNEKQTTSSSFSERMRNTLGNIFPFTMGGGTGNEGESQEEEEDEEEQVDFGSQVSLNSLTQENEAYVERETGTVDKFGVVRTISKEVNTPGQSRHTSNLEGTALNCVMAKEQYQRDTGEKSFVILLNRFGSGVQGHQAMMRSEKRRQREDETIDKFLDDLEMLRRRSQPVESNRRINMAVASKFIDGVKNDDFRTMLATHYTPLSTNAPTPEELRLKSKEYLLLKPPSRSGYYKNNNGNFNNEPANQGNNWYKPRDDMEKRRSFANCSSTDHHVSACPTYKQGMKAIGFSLEDEDASELDHEDFMRGLIG